MDQAENINQKKSYQLDFLENRMEITAFGASDIGKTRSSNQDSIYVNQEKKLFIVADGMGGHRGGDIASAMTVELFPDFIFKNEALSVQEKLTKAVDYTNETIFLKSKENEKLKGMGTTIASIYIDANKAYITNVGDSRAYLIHNKELFQLSKDHSLVQEKISAGHYTRLQAAKDPMKNILVKAVGYDEFVEADVFSYTISKGDLFLICSDGMHGKVNEKDILFLINEHSKDLSNNTAIKLESITKSLIDQANKNGGQDNISVVLIWAN